MQDSYYAKFILHIDHIIIYDTTTILSYEPYMNHTSQNRKTILIDFWLVVTGTQI